MKSYLKCESDLKSKSEMGTAKAVFEYSKEGIMGT